jgi:hypothetical protein
MIKQTIDVNEIGRNDFARGYFKKDTSTSCHEVREGTPIFCVYACTEITSIFEGETLIDERAVSIQKECPDP